MLFTEERLCQQPRAHGERAMCEGKSRGASSEDPEVSSVPPKPGAHSDVEGRVGTGGASHRPTVQKVSAKPSNGKPPQQASATQGSVPHLPDPRIARP